MYRAALPSIAVLVWRSMLTYSSRGSEECERRTIASELI